MKRSARTWNNSDPAAMAKQSEAAIMWAFMDAKEDILRMAEALLVIGYPRRGTEEEDMNIEKYVQANFGLDDLTIE